MGVQSFERRLERLVEGAFGKAFRSGLQPVEIARRLLREMDAGRTLGVRSTVAPNWYLVALSTADALRFDDYADVLETELTTEAREHAREEGYHFMGPVTVQLVEDPDLRRGDLEIESAFKEGPGGRVGALVLPDGRRIALGERAFTIGRLPDSDLKVDDALASRRHAEIRPEPDGYRIVDLKSLNGTTVNAVKVTEHLLADGDLIGIGSVAIRFEAS
ncbi:MAG: DUF2662 domain-containing protein [Actinobacteria bacterium]|nr:DUF2662 domain-containing protein [Actinomycetota bacterium]